MLQLFAHDSLESPEVCDRSKGVKLLQLQPALQKPRGEPHEDEQQREEN